MKLAVKQIDVFVDLLSQVYPLAPAADLGQQLIFLHDPEHCLGILLDFPVFQPLPHTTVAIRFVCLLLTFPDLLRKFCITLWLADSLT